jgi:hypothetical protein
MPRNIQLMLFFMSTHPKSSASVERVLGDAETGIAKWVRHLAQKLNPLGAWLLTEVRMTDGLQQSFPLSQSPLFIPLALEGHTCAGAQGCAKGAIAC